MGIGIDARLGRNPISNVDYRAPLRKPCPELVVLGEPLTEPVEAFSNSLAREACHRLGTGIDLDAGNHAIAGEVVGEADTVPGFLAKRLVIENYAADVVGRAWSGKQHLAVSPTAFLGRFDLDLVEALLDRAARLVRRQDALVLGHHCLSNAVQLACCHLSAPPLGSGPGCGVQPPSRGGKDSTPFIPEPLED